MKITHISTIILILSFFSFHCSKNIKYSNIKYKANTVKKEYGNCNDVQEGCVELVLKTLKITEAPSLVTDSVQRAVNNFLYKDFNGSEKLNSIEELFDSLLTDYKSFKNNFPESSIYYSLERKINVVTDTIGIFSIALNEYSYLGGAHPNYLKQYINFEVKSGKELKLSDLFSKNYNLILTNLAERKFRQMEELSADSSLKEAGYFFENEKFTLSNNFIVTPREIIFYYNPYQIAPYVYGPIEVPVSLSEVKDIIPTGSLLKSFLKE